MIRTQEKRIPWLWVGVMVLPFFGERMVGFISQSLLAFTLDKHTKDTSVITFFSSVHVLLNIIVGPYIAWKSDRIWTRFGRRKPFAIIGWIGVAFFLLFLPNAPSLWMIGVCVFAYNFFNDMAGGSSYQPLLMEVVPPPQRGRMQASRQGMVLLAAIFLNFALVKNWDSQRSYDLGALGKIVLTGEQTAYWIIAAVIFVMAILIGFGVREVKPGNFTVQQEKFSFRTFFGSIFLNKQQLKVYMLSFSLMAMSLGLGSLAALMLTKQFGYSKAQMGDLFGWLKIAQLIIFVPVVGYLADRVDRLKLYLVGIVLSTLHPIVYWGFIHFVAPDNIPSLTAVMFFSAFDILVDFTVHVAMMPLVFDYIPKHRMGTMVAGMTICDALAKFILMNAVGVFVKYYSKFFCESDVVDYSSGYLFLFCLGLVATACGFYFLHERNKGRLIPFGKLEHEARMKEKETRVSVQPVA